MHASRYQKPNAHTYTNIITTLGRSRQVGAAREIFDTMRDEGVERNIFHYNAVSSDVMQSAHYIDSGASFRFWKADGGFRLPRP